MTRTSRPRVLMLTPQSPFPPHQGTTIRNYNLLARLARHADVDLVTLVEPAQPPPEQTPIRELCRHVWTQPAPTRHAWQRLIALLASPLPDLPLRLRDHHLADTVASLAGRERYDILLVEGLEVAPYAEVFLRHAAERPRVVYDAHNAEYILQKRAFLADLSSPLRWHAALYSLVQWGKLRRYEAAFCRQADHVIAVSTVDGENLRALGVTTPITVIPNAVDIDYYDAYQANGPEEIAMSPCSVVFTGKMDFRPNVDAVVWFMDQVWPRVRQAVPEVQFFIVGRSPHRRLFSRGDTPGVFITGEVPDVRPYLHHAQVYVAPLRVGGGTRLKLLEAMAMRRAIVSTTVGAEGYPVQSGEHLLLADTPEAFADAVVTLLRDEDLRRRLGDAAREFVTRHYDWDAVFPRFLDALLG